MANNPSFSFSIIQTIKLLIQEAMRKHAGW